MPKKAAIYIRVSTAEQHTDMQLNELREYADRRGYQIFDVYEDVITGAAKKRPALERMMKDAKKGKKLGTGQNCHSEFKTDATRNYLHHFW